MASKHGHVDKGSIRNFIMVMKRSSRGVVLVDHKAANMYQGMECTIYHCTLHATFVAKLPLMLPLHLSVSAACEEAHISKAVVSQLQEFQEGPGNLQ